MWRGEAAPGYPIVVRLIFIAKDTIVIYASVTHVVMIMVGYLAVDCLLRPLLRQAAKDHSCKRGEEIPVNVVN